jgi:hypothetical protein
MEAQWPVGPTKRPKDSPGRKSDAPIEREVNDLMAAFFPQEQKAAA